MERVTSEMIESIKQALPYLIMTQGPWGMLMVLFVSPVISLLKYLWRVITRTHTTKYTEILTTRQSKDYQIRNPTYYRVVWYIKEVVGTGTNVKYESAQSSSNYMGEASFVTPDYSIYEIDQPIEIRSPHGLITINHVISDESDTRRHELHISGPSEKAVRTFITTCSDEYRTDFETRSNDRKRSVRFINEWSDDGWIGTPSRVRKTFDNVFMVRATRELLINDIAQFQNSENLYVRDGIPYKRGYLFHGPPGTGKSSIWHAIATHLNFDVYRLNLSVARSRAEFKRLCFGIPRGSLVVVDDIDRVKVVMDGIDSVNTSFLESDDDSVAPSHTLKPTEIDKQLLLEVFDGYDCFSGCIIVFTSNDITKIDPALVRAGRIDLKIEVPFMDAEVVADVFRYFYGREVLDDFGPDDTVGSRVSTGDLINTAILPNRSDYDKAVSLFREAVKASQ